MTLHDIVTLIFQTIMIVALLFTLIRIERHKATIRQLRAEIRRLQGTDAHDTSPALIEQLQQLGSQYGPMGVALAAARLTDRDALIRVVTNIRRREETDPADVPITRTIPRP